MAKLILKATQKASLGISKVKDAKGNEAQLQSDPPPAWSSSDANVSVEAAADGKSAVVAAVGPVVDGVLVTVTGDADLGEGVKSVVGSIEVQVIAGDAVEIEIAAGAPEEQ